MRYDDLTRTEKTQALRLRRVLHKLDIHSRKDFMDKTDVDATAEKLEGLKNVGPLRAALLVKLRGMSIEDWEKATGLAGGYA